MSDEIPLSDAERAFFDAMNGGGEEDHATANGHDHHDDHGASGHEDNTQEEDTVHEDEDMDKEYGGQKEEEGQENVSDHHNMGESEDAGDADDSSVPLQSGAGDSSSSAVEANPNTNTTSAPENPSVVPSNAAAATTTTTHAPTTPVLPQIASSPVPVGAQEISNVNAMISKPGTPATNSNPQVMMPVGAPSESNNKTAGGKRKRLPQDVVGQLEDRISEDPKGDVDAWLGLIDEYKRKGKFDDARAVYERFLIVFPTAVRINHYLLFCNRDINSN